VSGPCHWEVCTYLFSTPCCAIEFLNWASGPTVGALLGPVSTERATTFRDRENVSRGFPILYP